MSFLRPLYIRDAIADVIKDAEIPGVLDNVFVGRSQNGWPEEGPFISVYTRDMDFGKDSPSDESYHVTCQVRIEIYAKGPVYQREGNDVVEINVDDQLDIIANYVASSIFRKGNDFKRAIQCGFDNYIELVRTAKNVDGSGEKVSGCIVMSLDIHYYDEVLYGDSPVYLDEIKNTLNVRGGDASKNIEWIIGAGNA